MSEHVSLRIELSLYPYKDEEDNIVPGHWWAKGYLNRPASKPHGTQRGEPIWLNYSSEVIELLRSHPGYAQLLGDDVVLHDAQKPGRVWRVDDGHITPSDPAFLPEEK